MLTKESIEEKTFKKGLFGYNKDEVNSFMREVSDEFASLQAKYDAAVAENELAQNSLRENSVKIYELEKQLEQAAPASKRSRMRQTVKQTESLTMQRNVQMKFFQMQRQSLQS